MRQRHPSYGTIESIAVDEASRLGIPRDVAVAYASQVRTFASVLAPPFFSPDLYISLVLGNVGAMGISSKLAKSRVQFAIDFYGEGLRSPFALEGSATGAGWDDNVHKTVGRLANLAELPDMVNLLGWSRGGITCFKIANKLAEIFPQIKVNIFAVDPVYGGKEGGVTPDVANVPATVQQMVVVLAMHERRMMFRPQAESMFTIDRGTTRAQFLNMPGGHDQQVEWSRGGPAARVTWHLAFTRLRDWGTRFKRTPVKVLSDAEVCREYAQMVLMMEQYKETGTTGVGNWLIGLGFEDRKLPRDPSLPSRYFINAHHWARFQAQFPRTAKFFLGREKSTKAVQDELRHEPAILRSLEAYSAARSGQRPVDQVRTAV